MQTWMELGASFIVALQSMGDWLILPMRFFSYLGTVEFFLLFLPILYWCVDSALGLRIGLILMTSDIINYSFKLLLAAPRPYWFSSQVRGLWVETSFGIPSGHAQHAASVWGTAAAYLKKKWAWALSIFLIFFIGFSRLYLGAHFPHDVLFGWLLGALLVWAFARLWEPAKKRLDVFSLPQKILLAFIVSLAFILVGQIVTSFRSEYRVPQEWTANAMLVEDAETPDPIKAETPYASAGVIFGLAVGAAWIESQGGFSSAGSLDKRALRYLVGIIGLAIFYLGLGELLPRGDGLIFYALRYIRYALIGAWVAGGAPWLFRRLNLT